jgi:hypothetical protein
MECILCKKEIKNYSAEFNRFENVDICQDCIDRFMRWQGSRMAKLFPTKSLKKRFENRTNSAV